MRKKNDLVAAEAKTRGKEAIWAAAILTALLQPGPAAAATPGKSYFYASREACAASGTFRKRECAAAFANAEAELRDLAPTFSSRTDCRLKFHYCEARRMDLDGEADSVAFSPLALGVEMVTTARGVEAAPVLAVETPPSLFPHHPVTREYVARNHVAPADEALAYNTILPADRFVPFPQSSAIGALARFAPRLREDAQREHEDAPIDIASHEETPEERRARLRNAPFVE